MLHMSLELKISDIPQYQHWSCEYSHKAAQRNKGDHLVLLFLRKDCQERFSIQAVHLQDEAQMCAAVAYSQGLDLRALGLDIVLYRKVGVASSTSQFWDLHPPSSTRNLSSLVNLSSLRLFWID